MGDFAGAVDEDSVVGAHARVDHADVGGDEADFGEGRGVGEGGGGFLFCSEDDAVRGCKEVAYVSYRFQYGVRYDGGWWDVCRRWALVMAGRGRSSPLMPRAVTPWLTALRAYSRMC